MGELSKPSKLNRNRREKARVAKAKANRRVNEEGNRLSNVTIVVDHIFYVIVRVGKIRFRKSLLRKLNAQPSLPIWTSDQDGTFGVVEASGDDGTGPSRQEIDQRREDDRACAKTMLSNVL